MKVRQVVAGIRDFAISRSAILTLAIFAVVGVTLLDGYGVSRNEPFQRQLGQVAISYALGGEYAAGPIGPAHARFYGTTFEVPLVLVERLLGLTDSRGIYLSRHLLTHLFFLAGGIFCALLAQKLFRSRWLALFALLMFVLHPRLYAHSFLNTKDIPFLTMFMIALYLVHWAFQRGTAKAFALCGVGVGVLINLRIMGILLFAAVLFLRMCDLFAASGWEERRRALKTGGTFVLTAAVALWVVSPYQWNNPMELIEAFAVLSQHPTHVTSLFQGELIRWPEVPPHYIPTWIAITTPPVVLLLSLVGMASVLYHGLTHPRDMLRNTPTRFSMLLVACLVLPVLAITVMNSNIYATWRHVYFLYAPMCVLAVFGLRWLALSAGGAMQQKMVYALAATGLAVAVIDMAAVHPYQNSYFNFLVDRSTPEHLRNQYNIEYEGTAYREGLEYLLHRYPSSAIYLPHPFSDVHFPHHLKEYYRIIERNLLILPEADRRRFIFADGVTRAGDFFITNHGIPSTPQEYFRAAAREGDSFVANPSNAGKSLHPSVRTFAPVVHTRRIYNNTILTVTALDPSLVDEATEDTYRNLYRATISRTPIVRSDFDLYLDGNALTWVKAPCGPADVHQPFFLKVFLVDRDNLPWYYRKAGFIKLLFGFPQYGVRIDGACMMRTPLPDYPIHSMEAGQEIPQRDELWRIAITLSPEGAASDMAKEAHASPVAAVNAAVREQATGDLLMICIDGTRLASSHLVRRTVEVLARHPRAFTLAGSRHLGCNPLLQNESNALANATDAWRRSAGSCLGTRPAAGGGLGSRNSPSGFGRAIRTFREIAVPLAAEHRLMDISC